MGGVRRISATTADGNQRAVEHMARQGLLHCVLLSQDSGWYHVGEPGGGRYNRYSYIYTDFLPRLPRRWLAPLLWENPRTAFGR